MHGHVVEAVQVDDDVELRAERLQVRDGHELLGLLVAGHGQVQGDGGAPAMAGQLGQARGKPRQPLLGEDVGDGAAHDRDDQPVRRATLDRLGRGEAEAAAVAWPEDEPDVGMEHFLAAPPHVGAHGGAPRAGHQRVTARLLARAREAAALDGHAGHLGHQLARDHDDRDDDGPEEEPLPAGKRRPALPALARLLRTRQDRFTALITARTVAATGSASIPTPQRIRPLDRRVST